METEYLESLNPEQRAAVEHEGSPLLILAGAGSGKTRVITTKIAYLIQKKDVRPESILAVTFTKKAAQEMRSRAETLESRAAAADIRTFHSFGAQFLRRYAAEAGLSPSFTVYDDSDAVSLLSKAVPSLTKKQAAVAAHKISLAKDYCLFPEDDLSGFDSSGKLNAVYAAYQSRLRATGNADFGDLIMLPVRILETNERIRAYLHSRFRVIMVDEYQDSNAAQFRLLRALAGSGENTGIYVCVVGDDDQSIYKFRGAEVQNILRFREQFPGTQLIRLERNYRSTGRILAAADAVVRNNRNRLGKTLVAERGDGARPCLVFLENQDCEAAFCAELIQKAHQDQKRPCRYSDWAVLYRTNAQSLGFETEFLHRNIPYAVIGSLKFYEREEIKDCLSYLALTANPGDEMAFRRAANKPRRGIGESSQDKIVGRAAASASSSASGAGNMDILAAAEAAAKILPKKAGEGVRQFCSIMSGLCAALQAGGRENGGRAAGAGERLSSFVQKAVEVSGLLEYHQAQDEIDGTTRAANIAELVNSAALYPCTADGLLEFLDSIELDRTLASGASADQDAVKLITLHNTKGLEFPRVIITGLENGIFPRADKTGGDLEEERRLFYVGITRAKDMLYVTSCAERRLYGRFERMTPSCFLAEAGDVFQVLGERPHSFRSGFSADRGGSGFGGTFSGRFSGGGGFSGGAAGHPAAYGLDEKKAAVLEKWSRGTRVYHDDWGYGNVVKCSCEDGEVVATVQFETGARKKFLPEYQSGSLAIISC